MPKSNERVRIILQLILALLWAGSALAAPSRQQIESLHDAVGAFVDAEENDRYHLFSNDVGLVAARVYQVSSRKRILHLIGLSGSHAWMVTQKLSKQKFDKLRARIEQIERLQGEVEISKPVHTIATRLVRETALPLELKLADNSRLYGHITGCSESDIQFVTVGGTPIQIRDEQIIEVRRPQGKILDGKFVRDDPNDIRLFFGATGRTLSQGEGNFSDFYIFFPTVAIGVTDNFQLGGGVSIIPGASTQLVYFSPKLRVLHQDNIDLALGMAYIGVLGEFGIGSAYGALSVGSPAGGVTVGAAIPFTKDGIEEDFVALLFGAEKQVSSNLKLISENWLLFGTNDSVLLVSGGFRFIGDRLTVGLGFFTFPELLSTGEGFPLIPWLDFSLSFGK